MTKIADLIHIPERVHQGDFVLKLTEGVRRPEDTLRSYVVTPQLVQCFDQALSLIRSAVEANTSKGAYLHGSFGSGKSHFMAVLSLLLQNHPGARSIPELAEVVSRHNRWTQERRFLVVPYHLIGATSLESAVLGQYADYVRKLHPEAPTPGFYRAEKLFEDARRLRERMGDAQFFAQLGQHEGGDEGWGALDSAWDAASFEAALAAPPGTEERARLVGDLVDSFFGSARDLAAGREEGFVSLDEGLVILSRHARDLGYDAVVLFLDELILWLASHAADLPFLQREGQKVVKLVESTLAERPIPVVSFIARQRDLRELVGEHLPGAEQLGFADVLNWWEARFGQITLEDRNLPAIVEKRLLQPVSGTAARQLEEAFERTARVREEVLGILLTREGNREMFRQVYPFSPALIDTLVAVSSLLQRERTALKLLVQLLVDQRETLELGDLVPVGDLFDVIESGDEPFTQAMRIRFEQARKLYHHKLLPLLEEQHGVTREQIAANQVDAARLQGFRNDARLLKTLILAALAEGVEVLRSLTPARLAALNHGTVRSPIPGQESQIVLRKVRDWAARVGEIKVADDGPNPMVSLHLVGVDTEGILENARAVDNHGTRIQKVRSLLFEMLGIRHEESLLPPKLEVLWRGTRRACEILFRNVRELPHESFEPQDAPWRIIIDYPFDQGSYNPRYDLAKIQEFQAAGGSAQTLVWLPLFFRPQALEELGRLVVLEHVLSGNRLDEYGAHLSQLDREQARVILANQRDQMRQRIRNALLSAYGISTLHRDALDTSDELETQFHALLPGLRLQPPVGAGFQDSLAHLYSQALDFQFPAHPRFEGEVKMPGLRRVLEVVRRAVQAADRRVEVERADRDEVRRIAVPLRLGQMGEAHFVLGDEWVREFDQKRSQDEVTQITVGRLREWIDRPSPRGLPPEVENLVILTFALQTNRSFYLHGGAVEPALERLPNELELREEALPEEPSWQEAVQRASAILGITVSPLRNAANLARLVDGAQQSAETHREAVEGYRQDLNDRLARLDVDPPTADRLRTARAAGAFLAAIAAARREGVAAAMAAAEVATSATAMGECIRKAASLRSTLKATRWELFEAIGELQDPYRERAVGILSRLREALTHDEHVTALEPALNRAQAEAVALLGEAARRPGLAEPAPEPKRPTPEPPTPAPPGVQIHKRRQVAAAELEPLLAELRSDVAGAADARVEVEWRVYEE
ncbi:MAG: DUF6079 family protein [Longimicrobiaceae bacterium]